jgi:pimeloyl-ACP methyl ester carboxylesterase
MNIDALTTWVDVGGLRFPVVDAGAGQPVLLLHGFPDSRHLWRHQIPALVEAGYRAIAPDLRGFGDAPRPQEVEAYRMSTVMQDIIGILDALHVERAHLIAHDWGAALAWRFAAAHPERVGRSIALSIGHPESSGWETMRQRELFWYQLFFQYEGIAEDWLRRENWRGLREWTRGQGDLDRAIASFQRPGALSAALNWYRAHSRPRPISSSPAAFPPIRCPVLGIWGDGDAFIDEATVKNSGEHLAGPWQYEKIAGASHWIMLDKPDELNRVILAFLGAASADEAKP